MINIYIYTYERSRKLIVCKAYFHRRTHHALNSLPPLRVGHHKVNRIRRVIPHPHPPAIACVRRLQVLRDRRVQPRVALGTDRRPSSVGVHKSGADPSVHLPLRVGQCFPVRAAVFLLTTPFKSNTCVVLRCLLVGRSRLLLSMCCHGATLFSGFFSKHVFQRSHCHHSNICCL